jgi:hypothetical protein
MLSDVDINVLADKMRIDNLAGCFYKSQLKKMKFKPDVAYIINLEDEDEIGHGTHFTCLVSQTNPSTKELEYFYFDSVGAIAPKEVYQFTQQKNIPYSDSQLQGILSNESCGYWCLALLYMLNVYPLRSNKLYENATFFINLFDNLYDKSDVFKNEYMLKSFFNSINEVPKSYVKHIN